LIKTKTPPKIEWRFYAIKRITSALAKANDEVKLLKLNHF